MKSSDGVSVHVRRGLTGQTHSTEAEGASGVTVVARVLSSVLLPNLALDHPFRGGVRLSTKEVDEVLEMLRTL